MNSRCLILLPLLLAGCSFETDVSEEDLNKIVSCVDTRDGEAFQFYTNDITNVRIGTNGGSFEVTDLNCKKWLMDSGMNAYMKCTKEDI